MASFGEEQQRLKILKETELEILSIEKELKRIGTDRLLDQAEFLKNNSRLRADIKKALDDQQKNAESRKNTEEQMRLAVEKYNTATNDVERQTAEVFFERWKKQSILDKLQIDIDKSRFETIQEEIKLEEDRFRLMEAQTDSAISFLGKFGEIFSIQKKYNSGLKQMTTLSTNLRGIWAGVFTLIELAVTKFLEFDKAAAKFRITMGMMRTETGRISDTIKEVAIEMTQVGVTIDSAVDAAMALADEFGGTMKISKDLVETTSLLKAQLGVAEATSAGFMRNMGALSETTAQSQKNMVYFTSALSSAAGVPLNMVMQDVAKMSGNALAMISKMPLAIVKSAVAARQMGTTINKMADASANLLNFTESVQAEMDASVLVGEAINLQLARQLAYQGNIVGSTKAIVAEAKRINFEKLDYFQMQAFATASGRSVDELLKMIQAQRQLEEARGIDGLSDEVKEYERLMGLREADLNNVVLQRELAVKQMANQERIAALQQQWNQLLLQSTALLFPIIDTVLKLGIFVTKLGPMAMPFFAVLKMIAEMMGKITIFGLTIGQNIGLLAKYLTDVMSVGKVAANIFATIGKGFGFIGKVFGFLSKFSFLASFAKAIPVIGWIITGLTFVYNLVKRLMAGEGIGAALKGAIYDTVVKPFKDAWEWIKGIFVGNSPSTLALGIVRGIIGVQAMIFDALTYPFRQFLAWIVDKIPGMGGIAKKLRGGMTGALEDAGILEKKAVKPETTPLGVKTEATATPTTTVTTVPSPEEQKKRDQDSLTLGNILSAINQLNANLAAGKIGVYIDGQLMSATISRQTAFKGGYGMNVA